MLRPIPFASKTATPRSSVASNERLINVYPEANPDGAKNPLTLYGTPGLKLIGSYGTGPIRGVQPLGQNLFVVSGNELYYVRRNGTSQRVGQITGSGNVRMTANATHVAIATTSLLYAADESSLVNLPESGMVGAAYQDGYAIFAQGGGQKFFVTPVDNLTTINALDYSTADVDTGVLRAVVSDHREVWLFKDRSIECWYNSGDAQFPFARSQSGYIERGCLAGGSAAKADNAVYWLGDDKAVYVAQGYQPQRISTPAIERMIAERVSAHSAEAFCYSQEGHSSYVLSFADLTLVFDSSTGIWHERASQGMGRWRANCHAYLWDKHVVGDIENGNLYELDLDTFSENGAVIQRRVVAPPLHNNGQRLAMSELFVDLEAGVGLNEGKGVDPRIWLDWSDDGGKTWSNAREASMGPIGEYGYQARWNRLGAFRQRSIRLTISSPVKVALLGAYARLEPML